MTSRSYLTCCCLVLTTGLYTMYSVTLWGCTVKSVQMDCTQCILWHSEAVQCTVLLCCTQYILWNSGHDCLISNAVQLICTQCILGHSGHAWPAVWCCTTVLYTMYPVTLRPCLASCWMLYNCTVHNVSYVTPVMPELLFLFCTPVHNVSYESWPPRPYLAWCWRRGWTPRLSPSCTRMEPPSTWPDPLFLSSPPAVSLSPRWDRDEEGEKRKRGRRWEKA